LPGVVGGLAAILAIVSLANLPVNIAGALLMLLALVLFIADLKAPTHGFLSVGGVFALLLGMAFLINTGPIGLGVNPIVSIAVAAITLGFFAFFIRKVLAARRQPAFVGGDSIVVALIAVFSSLRIAAEYERGVVFRLGRLIPLKGPGLFFIIPFGVDRLVKIDLRTITLEVPPQEIITNDNVTAKVNAVIYFQVIDARKAVTQVLKISNADGEFQASQTLANAAQVISSQQGALQLRFLQTMVEIGSEKNTTVILPLPIELFKPLIEFGKAITDGSPSTPVPDKSTRSG